MNVLHDNKVLTFSSNVKEKKSKAKDQKDLDMDKHITVMFAQLFLSKTSLDEDTDREEFLSQEHDEGPIYSFWKKNEASNKS